MATRLRGGNEATARARSRKKFLHYFPDGFRDGTYLDWERGYKWTAHETWEESLGKETFRRLIRAGSFDEIARRAVAIESRTNLLFSFEKMALRDAVKMANGARTFANELFAFLHGRAGDQQRFERWCEAVASLPRRQTRVLTWPVVSVFGFIAQPDRHIFVKPNVTRRAAEAFHYPFEYRSRPGWATYASALGFAESVRKVTRDLKPRDLIDLQSFIWVLGSDEYPD